MLIAIPSCEEDNFLEEAKQNSEALKDNFFDFDYINQNNLILRQNPRMTLRNDADDAAFIDNMLLDMQVEEQSQSYIAELINKMGYAVWTDAHAMEKNATQEKLMIMPFVKAESIHTEGIMIGYEYNANIYYTFIQRGGMDTLNISDSLKYHFAHSLAVYDNYLFGITQADLGEMTTSVYSNSPISLNCLPCISDPCEVLGVMSEQCWDWISTNRLELMRNNAPQEPVSELVACTDPPCGGGGGDIEEPDSLIFDNLIDYPCAYNLIQGFGNINDTFAQLIYETFGTVEDFNVTFYVGNENSFTATGSLIHFDGTLTLDSTYLSGSEDYILATIIHELFHAYIQYKGQQKALGLITQEEFAELFPEYSLPTPNGTTPEKEHNVLGGQLQVMSNVLMSHNPNLQSVAAESICWEGLFTSYNWLNQDSITSNDTYPYILVARGEHDETNYPNLNFNFINCP